jgi:cytochrome c553
MNKPLTLAAALSAVLLSVTTAHAAGDIQAGKAKSAVCAACHGADGNSAGPTFPKLAGQVPGYIAKQLADFKSGKRKDPTMAGMAAPLTPEDMQNLDAYYASLKPKPGAATDKKLAEEGGKLYRGGDREMNVPACMSCHGPSGHGVPPHYPRVSGQLPAYTEKQLLAFKAGTRANDANDIMRAIAFKMSEHQIKAAAQYMYGLR